MFPGNLSSTQQDSTKLLITYIFQSHHRHRPLPRPLIFGVARSHKYVFSWPTGAIPVTYFTCFWLTFLSEPRRALTRRATRFRCHDMP